MLSVEICHAVSNGRVGRQVVIWTITALGQRRAFGHASQSGTAGMQVFPLEVIRRRMQTMAADSVSRKAGMEVLRQAVQDIWAREKLKGFYAGMLPNTIQVDTRLPDSPQGLFPKAGLQEAER